MARWAYIVFLAGCMNSLVAELCQDNLGEPVGIDCSKFKYCRGGQWIEGICSPPRELFDPNRKKCVGTMEYKCPVHSTSSQCNTEGYVRPNEQCIRYDVCINGNWLTYQCENGYAFDITTSTCVTEKKANCYGCEKNQPNLNDCNSFYTCQGTKKVKRSCAWLMRFDSVSRECVWLGAECHPLGTCDEENKKIPTSNCKEYLECKSGNLYKKTCGFSQVFDSIKGSCVWVWPWHKCAKALGKRCTEGDTKILGCKSYNKCILGVWHALECREGEIIKNGKCVEEACTVSKKSCNEYNVNGEKLICGSGHYFDTNSDRCTSGFCDDRSITNYKLTCTENEVRRVKGTCKKYTVCTNGVLVEHVCDKCKNFNDNKNKCMFVWDSPCTDGPTTSPPPPTSDTTVTSTTPTSDTTLTSTTPTSDTTLTSTTPTSDTTLTSTTPTSDTTLTSTTPTSDTTLTSTTPTSDTTLTSTTPTSDTTLTSTTPTSDTTLTSTTPTSDTTLTSTTPTSDTTLTSTTPTSDTTLTSTTPTSDTTVTPTTPISCEIGSLKPDLLSCHHYYECDKNQSWEHKKCAWLFYYAYFFDVDTLKCKFMSGHCAK